MTTGSVLRAVIELALAYAIVGIVGAAGLALLAGDLNADVLPPWWSWPWRSCSPRS